MPSCLPTSPVFSPWLDDVWVSSLPSGARMSATMRSSCPIVPNAQNLRKVPKKTCCPQGGLAFRRLIAVTAVVP